MSQRRSAPELGNFPQILSRCGEQKFVFGAERSAQAQSAQLQNPLQMREQHLNFFPLFARGPIVIGLGDVARHVSGVFMDRARDFARRFLWTALGFQSADAAVVGHVRQAGVISAVA